MDKTASNATADSERLPDPKQATNLIPGYSDDEIQYLGSLQKMLENGRNLRDTNHDEYDGLTFVEHRQFLPDGSVLRGFPQSPGRRLGAD
jgi:hypothetical protein